MNCSNCNKSMVHGVAEVHGTALGFLVFGWSRQQLWFKAAHRKNIEVLHSGGSSAAWRCDACDITAICKNEEPELNFGQIVEASQRAAPNQAL